MTAMVDHSDRLRDLARPKRRRQRCARWLARLRCLIALALMSLIAALTTAFAPTPALAFDSHLSRYPYLTGVVGSSATIYWATDQSSAIGLVRWGQVGVEGCTAHAT